MKMKVWVCCLFGVVVLSLGGCGYKIGGPPAEVTYRKAPTTAPSPGEQHDAHKH
jgi:hypothetical protein